MHGNKRGKQSDLITARLPRSESLAIPVTQRTGQLQMTSTNSSISTKLSKKESTEKESDFHSSHHGTHEAMVDRINTKSNQKNVTMERKNDRGERRLPPNQHELNKLISN